MFTRSVWLAGLLICLIGLPELGHAQSKGKGSSRGSDRGSSARSNSSRSTPSVSRSRSSRTPSASPSFRSRTPSSSSRSIQGPTRSTPTPSSSSRSTPSILNRSTRTSPKPTPSRTPSRSLNTSPSISNRGSSSLDALRSRLQSSQKPGATADRSRSTSPTTPSRIPSNSSSRDRSSFFREFGSGNQPSNQPNINRNQNVSPRPNTSQPTRDLRDMFNRSNRPDSNQDRGSSATPNTSRPGSSTVQPSRDIRDMFNRTNRPNLDQDRGPGQPSTNRGPSTSPDRTPNSDIRSRFRPGDASDIRSRLEALNRGDANTRPSLPDRGNQNRSNSADRDGRPSIDRDSLPWNRSGSNRPDADRPGPGPGDRDQADRSRPGRGPDSGNVQGPNRPDRGPSDRVANGPEVRPKFDWKDRSNRDPQFRERLEDVRRRGSLDDGAIRDRLANVEDRFNDGNRNRDGNRGDFDRNRDGRRGDWDRDRDWDGRWDDKHRRHVPDNWYRHAHNVRHHYHDRFAYGWNSRWYPNNRYLSSWYFHTYRPRPGYWWTWCSPYRLSNWYFWGSYPSYPVYYDYGSTIVYDSQYIYVEEEPIATREQYALEAIALANEGRKILQSRPPIQGNGNPDDWLPLGVFVLTDTQSGQGDIYLQLAVDREGLLAGTYYNASTGNSLPVWGKVDPQSQRAAWLIGESSGTVMETGIYNLSQEAASVLVHYGTQRDETWMLVRLPEDEVTNPSS